MTTKRLIVQGSKLYDICVLNVEKRFNDGQYFEFSKIDREQIFTDKRATFVLHALRPMTKIGVTVLHLYESSNGVDFHLVRTYRSSDYPEMMGTGMHFFEDIITYNGTPGYRYFVDAFCYAGDKTGYDEKAYSSVVKTAVR